MYEFSARLILTHIDMSANLDKLMKRKPFYDYQSLHRSLLNESDTQLAQHMQKDS